MVIVKRLIGISGEDDRGLGWCFQCWKKMRVDEDECLYMRREGRKNGGEG